MTHSPYPNLFPMTESDMATADRAVAGANIDLYSVTECLDSLSDPLIENLEWAMQLAEAKASCAIEGIECDACSLFRAAMGYCGPTLPEACVIASQKAAIYGKSALKERPLRTEMAVEITQMLKQQSINIRKLPGTQIKNPVTGEVHHTPPEGESLIRGLLADWERFIHDPNYSAMLRMSWGHIVYESIHPFPDGNGRSGRIINQLVVHDNALLTHLVLAPSLIIDAEREAYYQCFSEFRDDRNGYDPGMFLASAFQKSAQCFIQAMGNDPIESDDLISVSDWVIRHFLN